jgi:hypothetical protein
MRKFWTQPPKLQNTLPQRCVERALRMRTIGMLLLAATASANRGKECLGPICDAGLFLR